MMLKQACLVLLLYQEIVKSSKNGEDDLPKRIFKSLEKVLDYIYENRQDMNVDGLFGVVFAEVHLQNLQGALNFVDTKSVNHAKNKVWRILEATKFNKMSLNSKHKIFFRYVLDSNLWKKNISFTFGNFSNDNEKLTTQHNVKTCNQYKKFAASDYFSEEMSDQCLIQLIKSSIVTPNNCHIDEICSDYMLDSSYYYPAYGITHRLLFLQVAEARNCSWNKNWMETRIAKYCSYIYWEAEKNAYCGFIPEMDDLFLEQILLCGYEGFVEFLQTKWMEYVLTIQTKHGCFGIFGKPYDHGNELRKRRKRESNVIKYGCLDHTTGLGAGVLSLFLRYLEDTEK